ncbi:hypothetical protein P691DRAFT_783543 [Macrolepiota fuliginosa MF-IS2]|uniref:Uncharacterized protein n=1 Tax=Macrolepiota fuliginosa MF-IS2 TaxID=1400762 RepID=A0A9P5WY67_9AGAR|nr:hypothetical protein P691DRAFT_783543 [Macrolepiota fuliginosa MF-IS2]
MPQRPSPTVMPIPRGSKFGIRRAQLRHSKDHRSAYSARFCDDSAPSSTSSSPTLTSMKEFDELRIVRWTGGSDFVAPCGLGFISFGGRSIRGDVVYCVALPYYPM